MFSVYLKEITSFFSGIIGYLVIIVFFAINGIFLWIVPETNIYATGYATLDQLFEIAPWVFLFLVPAITMRTFSEERKSGTFEILLTKPVNDLQLLLGKYFASITLIAISILPTLIYYYSVYHLAVPVGNVDSGGIWGSYIGLLLLGSSYAAIGIFTSVITDNQIIAFIISMLLSFFFYLLLDLLRGLIVISPIDPVLEYLSINTHYISISRGVLDSRDLLYFISFSALFIVIAKMIIEKRKW